MRKFIEAPLTTIVSFEDPQPTDAPWLTFCQTPVYNFARMEEVVFNASGFRRTTFSPGEGFNPQQWAGNRDLLNMTMNDYLDYLTVPLWTTLSECTIRSGSGQSSPAGWNCAWPRKLEFFII
jgi:hypothetical protein